MSGFEKEFIGRYFSRSLVALQRAIDDLELANSLAAIAQVIVGAFNDQGKVLIAGNGGSAADAQHLAAEFLSRFVVDRRPLPCIALTTDTSVLTAIGNDYGFEQIFARQLSALARSQDIFIAISTSGRSPNVLAALQTANQIGLKTIGFTGLQGEEMRKLCDYCVVAPSNDTAIIQQIHIIAGHIVCGLVEGAIHTNGS